MSRHFTALVNPISGAGVAADRWRELAEIATAAGAQVSVELTRSSEHATEIAAAAAANGDVVVAVGGDGLVLAACAGVVAAGAGVLGIAPAGRGNDLARKLGIPSDPRALANLLITGEPRAIDVLDAGGTIVPGNVYAGLDSVATLRINARRRLPGKLNYRLTPVETFLGWKPPTFTVTVDGETITTLAHMVVVANSGTYGHGLDIVPGAVVDDGLLDVLIVRATKKRHFLRFQSQLGHGSHLQRSDVTRVRGVSASVATDRPIPVGADGEDLGLLPTTVTVRPAALKVLAP
ncbi:YegS/Rv2252/BmrU family lipid kinase [Nocardia flavorosea]|uniref:diacylglycerol/lipid kinase family protein n=1 Tax=Nocardia flavorosea TaxID=53429 RepID=UPI001892D99A|nr:YegS/Rv2252/BmrU family lipid kinase [Nocardia flavorosea]MBF6350964.1 YegS/Rv2252/BmrU family lipid kinase [Nocardia flavorosea]